MKKILSLFLLAFALTSVTSAQKVFEGELHYRSMENYDQNTVDMSFGTAYNGARNTKYIIKGNKVLLIDECTHMRTLVDSDNNTTTIYNELIGKGMQFSSGEFAKVYFTTFSEEGPSYDIEKKLSSIKDKSFLDKIPSNRPTVYRFEKENDVMLMDRQAEYIKGRIENMAVATDFDIYAFSSYVMPKAYSKLFLRGIDIDKLIGKIKYEQTLLLRAVLEDANFDTKKGLKIAKKYASKLAETKLANLSEIKSYMLNELKTIIERNVDDSEFIIPADINIDKSEEPTKLLTLSKEVREYLLEHNLYPTQKNKEVIYKIEDEWDF